MKWLYKLTGGRPMKRGEYAFRDVITGHEVYYFVDAFDRKWMAEHAWSLFRVRTFV